jgi:hypothetical protein
MAILLTIGMTVLLIPMMLVTFVAMPATDPQGNPINLPVGMFIAMPLIYLVFSYLFVAIGCWLYNVMYRFIGGFEYEAEDA